MPNRVVVPHEPGFSYVFNSRDGIVGRNLWQRATRVELAAKAQVGVKTGGLRRDIKKDWQRGTKTRMTIRVGSSLKRAYWHHQGTRPHIIRPRQARALRFIGKNGEIVFAQMVRHPGTRANRFLADNVHLATL